MQDTAQSDFYRGRAITLVNVRVGGEVVARYAAQTKDNANRVAAGERPIGGDTLHSTLDAARKEIDFQIRMEEDRAASDAASAARDAEREAANQKARAEFEDVDGFTDGMSPMRREKVLQALNANVRYQGEITTRKALVRNKVAQGYSVREHATFGRILSGIDGAFHERC